MSDNPFAEPGDHDRTVIRPKPGGTRAASPTPPPRRAPEPPAETSAPAGAGPPRLAAPSLDTITAGRGPLATAAAPLLHLLARLRNTTTAPDPGDMVARTRRELRAFEERGRAAGVPQDQLRAAHYALCAALDDVVLNTPWGSHGRWRDAPLAKTLHNDDRAGQGFFDQLRTLRAAMPQSLPVLDLMFTCLSLGMMGPYREAPDGAVQLERIRHHVFELIAKASPPLPAGLAPDTAGIDVPARPRRAGVPVWVAGSAALALVAAVYVWGLTSLNAASDQVAQAASAAPPAAMPTLARPPSTPPPPAPPAPAAPGPADRLRTALADVAEVEVIGTTAGQAILRIPSRLLFPQPNATLAPGHLLERVGTALRPEAGSVRVTAYTDTQPSRSVRFASNFALSTARAAAVRAALARILPDPVRIQAEGRGEAEPVAPNTTAEGREQNRRIEIGLAPPP